MKKHLKRILFLLTAAGVLAFVSTGCQTTEGIGEDVENLGEEIQGN